MNDRNSGGGAASSIDHAIHRQRVNQRATAGKLFKMPKPTLAALPGAAAARAFPWPWPATCGSWRPTRS
jgi:2-(1,2-epoxy-1,2-dihydrophenyl)acetyl-CoA isomerase